MLTFCLAYSLLRGQVDISQYVNTELFKAKPVITQEFTDQKSRDNEPVTYFQNDVAVGLEYWNNNKLDEAVNHFNVMIDMYPELGFLHYYVGAIYYDKKKYDLAIASLYKALKIDPFLLESRYLIGLIQIEMKDLKAAKKSMELLMNVKKYTAHSYYGMGMIANDEGNYLKAIRMYEKCLDEDSTFLQAYIPLASTEMIVNNRIDRALNLMNKAVMIDSTWQDARIFRAILSVNKKGGIDQFDKDINVLIRQDPKNYHYYSIRGFLDIELLNYTSAVYNFRNALNLSIDSIEVGEYRFSTRLKRNKSIQSALNYYYDKSKLLKDSTRFYIDRGVCDFICGNIESASVFYNRASNYEDSGVVDFFKAVLYNSQMGRSSEALTYYSKSIHKDSLNYAAYASRVELYILRSEIQAAFSDCNMMIKLEPRRKEGYKTRGSLFLQTGNYHKAYIDFTSGILLDSTDSDLFFNRATSAFNTGYYDQSNSDFMKVIQKKPKMVRVIICFR